MEHLYQYNKDFVDTMRWDTKAYAFIEPALGSDIHRHGTASYWNRNNPMFDKNQWTEEKSYDHPEAVHGVYHGPFSNQTGHGKTRINIKSDSLQLKHPEVERIRHEMENGTRACLTEAMKFVEEILGPDLVERRVAAVNTFPELAT